MFALVCWTQIVSQIMHLETRKPMLFVGLSGLYKTVCNVSTREGPPHRKQAKKLAVAQKIWKSWEGRQNNSSHAVLLPRYRQCLPASHQGCGPGAHLCYLVRALPEDVPAHGWQTSLHQERALNNEIFLKVSCLRYNVAHTDTACEYLSCGTEGEVFLKYNTANHPKKCQKFFSSQHKHFESMTSMHRAVA